MLKLFVLTCIFTVLMVQGENIVGGGSGEEDASGANSQAWPDMPEGAKELCFDFNAEDATNMH